MKRTLYGLAWISCGIAFCFGVFLVLVIGAQLLGKLATGGWSTVEGWIFHIGSLGEIRAVEGSPGTFILQVPSPEEMYRSFLLACATVLLSISFGWLGLRYFTRKLEIQPATKGEDNSSAENE